MQGPTGGSKRGEAVTRFRMAPWLAREGSGGRAQGQVGCVGAFAPPGEGLVIETKTHRLWRRLRRCHALAVCPCARHLTPRKVGRRGLSCLGKTPHARLCKSGPRALTGSHCGGGPLVPSWVAAPHPQAFVQRRSKSRHWSGQGEAGRQAKALPFPNAAYKGKFAWGASGSVCILEIGRKVQVPPAFLLGFPQTPSTVWVFLRDSHDCLQGLQPLPLSWSFHRVRLCGFQQ